MSSVRWSCKHEPNCDDAKEYGDVCSCGDWQKSWKRELKLKASYFLSDTYHLWERVPGLRWILYRVHDWLLWSR